MPRKIGTLAATTALIGAFALAPAGAAEREQVRAVINLIAAVKMPFPEKLRNNLSRTELVVLDTNASTTACLRLDDKMRWCYEHIAAYGSHRSDRDDGWGERGAAYLGEGTMAAPRMPP